jgi:ATP phosphoribosyltransferase
MPKGRVLDEAVARFAKAGLDLSVLKNSTRKLIFDFPKEKLRVMVVRDSDVPTYVEYGAAHLGIAGRDILDEQGRDLYEPLDLGIGKCRLCCAEAIDRPSSHMGTDGHLRYATKYPNLTRRWLEKKGIVADVIKLYGSIELASLTGLSDRIVDLVSTGETLKQNRLREVETLLEVSARLVINRAALKLHQGSIETLLARLRAAG